MKGVLVHINGGMGKCVLFTAVAKSFKQQYPDQELVVVSGFPEVFLNNRNVDRNFAFNQHGLWRQYYSNDDYDVVAQDPYLHEDWIKGKSRHLIDVWCDLLDVDSLYDRPELFFSGPEVEDLQRMINVDRPLLVVQSTGGSNPGAVSWTRNPPTTELDDFLSKFSDSHYILHLCQPQTPGLKSVNQRMEGMSRRQALCLVYFAQEFVGIDSFGLHTRAANPNAGPSHFFLCLPEVRKRVAYESDAINYVPLTEEAYSYLESNWAYYATLSRYTLEEAPENCPVPIGVKWFDY